MTPKTPHMGGLGAGICPVRAGATAARSCAIILKVAGQARKKVTQARDGVLSYRIGLFARMLVLAAVALAPMRVVAQSPAAPILQSSTGIAAFVNGFVISNYDLDQRTSL